jgi:hypothetical protein
MKRAVKNNVYWVGKIDWELESFHGDDYSIGAMVPGPTRLLSKINECDSVTA